MFKTERLLATTADLISTDIGDHLPIFISTNLTVYQKDKGTKVNARDVSDENIRNFKNCVKLIGIMCAIQQMWMYHIHVSLINSIRFIIGMFSYKVS